MSKGYSTGPVKEGEDADDESPWFASGEAVSADMVQFMDAWLMAHPEYRSVSWRWEYCRPLLRVGEVPEGADCPSSHLRESCSSLVNHMGATTSQQSPPPCTLRTRAVRRRWST